MIDCMVWWAKPITESRAALALLDSSEHARHGAYRRQADRDRFLTGRVLAKTLAARYLGGTPDAVRFDASCADCDKQHGPVRIPGAALRLSISHSGERVGVAATDGAAVGLDVEASDRGAQDSLISYALNESELATLRNASEQARAQAFFTFWTRKEALMKATGRGLRIALGDLTMSAPGERARLLASADDQITPETTSMADLDPGAGYHAAVAVLTATASDEIDVTERWWVPEAVPDGQ